jgi:hypothetical protein
MRNSIEYEIIQNPALGAAAIVHAVVEYYKVTHEGMPLPMLMAVLPMVLNRKTTELIFRKNMVGGGLRKVKGEDRTLSAGLQRRMEGMANLTFRSLNIAVSCKNCLSMRYNELVEIIPLRLTVDAKSMGYVAGDTTQILSAAKRIGSWFGQFEMSEICRQLDLRF